jgi:N4-(beta-N-acetylglucosaminyl)-L-asparaginase
MSRPFQRRTFLKLSGLLSPAFAFGNFSVPAPAPGPIMLSTWDDGKRVNAAGWKVLQKKGRALDAIEAGGRFIENEASCCVGLDGFPDRDGIVTLDACVMDEQANCGAVAGLEQIRHPISVARKVMENTPHVLLVGKGAQQFALENGFPLESPGLSPSADEAYRKWLKESRYKPAVNIENRKEHGPFAPSFFEDGRPNHDTMAMIAMDAQENLSGGVTTSGLAFKMHGRVGDSAGIGAGLYVDNAVGAATSSGLGEEVIRICGTHMIVELMRNGYSPEAACKKAVERIIAIRKDRAKEFQVGFIALNKKGQHGAYAIARGFSYAVKTAKEDIILQAPHHYP